MRRLAVSLIVLFLFLVPSPPASAVEGWEDVEAMSSPSRKVRRGAAKSLVAAADPALIAGLVDTVFFTPKHQRDEVFKVLEKLAGEKVKRTYYDWVEWIGAHGDIAPRDGYMQFKLGLLVRIDRRYRNIFYDGAPAKIRLDEIVWGGVPVDGIPPIDRPIAIPGQDAKYMRDGEQIYGVDFGGEQRAYPLRHLSWHEMLNDEVGGQPFALSYCTLCGSGILYDTRRPSGDPMTFGTSGLLYRSNKLMYDRQSWSLWSNITGEAVVGRAAVSGRSVDILPMTLTTWKAWRAKHPATTVLAYEQPDNTPGFNYAPGAADRARGGVKFPVWLKNTQLDDKDEVYALTVDGTPKAYPLDRILDLGLVHDQVGDVEVVLVTEVKSEAVRLYRNDGRRFTRGTSADQLIDAGGGTWQVTEAAITPSDAALGAPLPRQPGHVAYWFGWFAFYPKTEVYGAPR